MFFLKAGTWEESRRVDTGIDSELIVVYVYLGILGIKSLP